MTLIGKEFREIPEKVETNHDGEKNQRLLSMR